jgi:hypothetical protein
VVNQSGFSRLARAQFHQCLQQTARSSPGQNDSTLLVEREYFCVTGYWPTAGNTCAIEHDLKPLSLALIGSGSGLLIGRRNVWLCSRCGTGVRCRRHGCRPFAL